MINCVLNIILLVLTGVSFYLGYYMFSGTSRNIFIFFAGLLFGILLMNLRIIVKDKKLGSYKRQLEKESVASDENAARVKVLEQKIKVLEKALDNALNKH